LDGPKSGWNMIGFYFHNPGRTPANAWKNPRKDTMPGKHKYISRVGHVVVDPKPVKSGVNTAEPQENNSAVERPAIIIKTSKLKNSEAMSVIVSNEIVSRLKRGLRCETKLDVLHKKNTFLDEHPTFQKNT